MPGPPQSFAQHRHQIITSRQQPLQNEPTRPLSANQIQHFVATLDPDYLDIQPAPHRLLPDSLTNLHNPRDYRLESLAGIALGPPQSHAPTQRQLPDARPPVAPRPDPEILSKTPLPERLGPELHLGRPADSPVGAATLVRHCVPPLRPVLVRPLAHGQVSSSPDILQYAE